MARIPRRFNHLPVTRRDEVLGAFPNWYLALTELVMRSPNSEAYFLVQDDVLFARRVRPMLEYELWPSLRAGVVSLYCPSHYAVDKPPGFHRENRGWKTWTAQALVFPNPSARAFLAATLPLDHRHHGPRQGSRNIDCIVGAWCRAARRPFYVFRPSLAEHIGETSTLYPHATATGRRRSSSFVGEDFDASTAILAQTHSDMPHDRR
jgi:hypothetical protein